MLSTRLLRLLTTLSYPDIAEVLARPNHSTVLTADNRLTYLLRLPLGDALRFVSWHGAQTDLAAVIDMLIADLHTNHTTVPEDVLIVCRDGKPRTTREIAIDVLLKRKEALNADTIAKVRKAATTLAGLGKLVKRGSAPCMGAMQWCYVLAESKE